MSKLDILRSPELLLASFFSQKESSSELVFISGKSGAGKTAWCQELIRRSRQAGITPVGLISPAVFDAGMKVGIDLVEIRTGDSRRLAVKDGHTKLHESAGPAAGCWSFSPDVFAWGNRVLDRLQHPGLLILDELGPLELLENQGLAAGLRLVGARRYRMACIVIRPALLPTAMERWPWGVVLNLGGETPDQGGDER